MKPIIIAIVCAFVLFGCNQASLNKIEREGQPNAYIIGEEDSSMNRAIRLAKITLPYFRKALESKNQDLYAFNVRVEFDAFETVEHIWIRNVFLKNSKYYGIVDNEPIDIDDKSIHAGDSILIDNNAINDWMYLENGVLRGGFTTRAIRKKMTEEERKQFDSQYGIIIED